MPMNVLYGIKVNSFCSLVEQLCEIVGVKNTNHYHSKQMYGNIKLVYLVCKKEQLNVSYRRFVEICKEDGTQRMLCLKKIPHFTTLQKFVARTSKELFEMLVKACRKLLNLKNVEASIDGTGFSNTNPSHYYQKRIDGAEVKNFTKTVFLTDNKTKLILNLKTTSDKTHETNYFKQTISEVADCLKTILADKGYDSMSNRKYCWQKNIEVHIPFRKWEETRKQEHGTPSTRKMQEKKFDKIKYNKRALIESVNSAIKQTLGGFVRARTASNQQKNVTIKAITYNIEHINRTIKIWIKIQIQ
jgi:IS5 family transposase